MKNIIKSVLAITAVATIGSASAETIYISGSTAFRSVANAAINKYCTNNGGQLLATNGTVSAMTKYVGSFVADGTTNFISVAWSGSEGGIQSSASPRENPVPNTFWASSATGTNSNNVTVSVPADASISDTFQNTSVFTGSLGGREYADLMGFDGGSGILGAVTFTWVASVGCPITNVTAIGVRNLMAAGHVPVALFTGNPAHETSGVYLVGRNSDSGTRLAAFGECGYGANTKPQQYRINSTSYIQLYPSEDINGITAGLGNSGYSSGSSVAGFMTNTYASGAALRISANASNNTSTYGSNYLIGYAGISDADGALSKGLVKLTYNGVESSTNNIANGSYTFWTYVHLYRHPESSALCETVIGAIGQSIQEEKTSTITPNVGYSDLRVSRLGDGTDVYQGY